MAKHKITCDPNECPHCMYVGEGDSWCDETGKIVIDNWNVTEDFMGPGCPYIKEGKKNVRNSGKA